jgi:DNA-binding GntR family transcriptional regulator
MIDSNLAESTGDLPVLERALLSQRAADLIRHAIVDGTLAPGETIGVRDLARRLNVSPTPIREALIQLSAVGLVEFHPGRVRIASATSLAIQDAFELREALEGMAARLAALRRTDTEANEIVDLAVRSQQAAAIESADEFRRLDFLFHRAIGKAAHSAQVARYLSNALDLAFTLRNLRSSGKRFKALAAPLHGAIADAIQRRAPDEAEAASREHVRAVGRASSSRHDGTS